MSSSPSPPTVADPNTVATNQQNLNNTAAETAQQGSMVNQTNPYGSLSYSQTGTSANGTPLYTAAENLTPAQQSLLNTLQGTQQTAGTQASNVLSGANYGSVPAATAIGNATSGLTGQAVQQEQQYLQPFFAPQVAQENTQLENEGFNPGTPGYQQAMNGLLQSQGQTETGFLANIEPQMYQQATSTYELPAQLAGSLSALGAPASENANLTTTPANTDQPANLIGATANANTANQATYQDQVQANTAFNSGLFGIGSAALGLAASPFTGGLSLGLLGMSPLASAITGSMPATGPGSPSDATSNAYAISQGINPYA